MNVAQGTPGTPGSATPLLNQTLIPFTMATSLCILKSVRCVLTLTRMTSLCILKSVRCQPMEHLVCGLNPAESERGRERKRSKNEG